MRCRFLHKVRWVKHVRLRFGALSWNPAKKRVCVHHPLIIFILFLSSTGRPKPRTSAPGKPGRSFSWPPAFCRFSAKKRRLNSASKGHRGNFVRPPLALKTASTYHRKGAPMSRVVCVPQEAFDVPPGDRPPPQTPSLDLSPSPSCRHLV